MRFRLRTIFVVITVAALFFFVIGVVERRWFGPARVGMAAQAKLDALFAAHGWQGYAGTWHYDYRVRIASQDIGDGEISKLYPILHEIPWLQRIELNGTGLSKRGVDAMKAEFPHCYFTVKDP